MPDVQRNEKGHVLPGQVLNPKGRTPIAKGGKSNDPHNLRNYIAETAHEVIDSMVKEALQGDVTAGNNLLKFILPQLQAVQVQGDANTLPIMKVITAVQEANKELEDIQSSQDSQDSQDSETVHNDDKRE